MNVSEWIAFAALGVSVFAAAQSLLTRRIAGRALSATLRQEQRAQSRLELYLVDAHILRRRAEGQRVYVFRVTVTNTADTANSVKTIDLDIVYKRRGSDVPLNVAVPLNSTTVPDIAGDAIGLPLSLAP